jgi:hypothetical protein
VRIALLASTLFVGLVPITRLSGQATTLVAGVAEDKTGKPLADAEVIVFDVQRIAHTNSLGEARIRGVPWGRHRVRVRKLGYAVADLELNFDGDSIGPVFMLERSAETLDTVRVTAAPVPLRLQPFETRRRMGFGRFLTDTQLVADWNRPFAYVAMSRFPGLAVMTDVDGQQHIVSTRSSCGGQTFQHGAAPPHLGSGGSRGMGGGGQVQGGGATMLGSCSSNSCPVRVYLDDMDLTEQDFDVIRTWDLAGVEYYTGASVPARYRVSGSACGVLLLWSR